MSSRDGCVGLQRKLFCRIMSVARDGGTLFWWAKAQMPTRGRSRAARRARRFSAMAELSMANPGICFSAVASRGDLKTMAFARHILGARNFQVYRLPFTERRGRVFASRMYGGRKALRQIGKDGSMRVQGGAAAMRCVARRAGAPRSDRGE